MTNSQNQPGVYAKGDNERLAYSASDAVALAFEGFRRTGDLPQSAPEAEATDETATAQPEAVQPGAAKPEAPKPSAPKSQTARTQES